MENGEPVRYVDNTAASATPLMDGTGAVGTSAKYAREDHVHPSDTTKVDKVSGKGLSTNDLTDALKTKLDGISAGAEVNQNAYGKISGLEHSSVSVVTTVQADEDSDTLFLSYEFLASSSSYTHITSGYDCALGIGNGVLTERINSYRLSNPVFGQGYGECSTEYGTVAKTASISGYKRVDGGIVSIKFAADVDASATLNINSLGALPIYFKGAAITAGVIKAGDIATLMLIDLGVKAYYELIAKTFTVATTTANGLMSATDKTKLNRIDQNAQPNQDAFNIVQVVDSGTSTGVQAGSPEDMFTLRAGTNVHLLADADTHVIEISATDTTYSEATGSAAGLMSSSDKSKLSGIAAGAEVNQNAFSNVKVGSATIAADGKTDTLELIAGSNITLTPDATNDKVTIAATDTKYTPASATPLMDGTGTAGTSAKYAREDHVHPSDTSKANLASPTFTGTPKAPTAAAGTNTTQIATTAFVTSAIASAQIGAALFKGTVSAGTDISSLTAYKKGWYWVVATAGTYAGQSCEAGDMIFCVADYSSSYKAADFSIVQNNIVTITNAEIDTIVAS